MIPHGRMPLISDTGCIQLAASQTPISDKLGDDEGFDLHSFPHRGDPPRYGRRVGICSCDLHEAGVGEFTFVY